MSYKTPYCVACGDLLNGDDVYKKCVNFSCPRWGLFVSLYLNTKPSKKEIATWRKRVGLAPVEED